jgi:hypothetical protein
MVLVMVLNTLSPEFLVAKGWHERRFYLVTGRTNTVPKKYGL